MLFSGVDASGDVGLWAWNGTSATELVAGLAATTGLHPQDITVYDGEVLFNAFDASGQAGLWVTNGTAGGTHEVAGTSGLDPTGMTVYNGVCCSAAWTERPSEL